jgi:hypothetical protein
LHPNIIQNVASIPYDFNVADIMSPTFLVTQFRRKCRRHLIYVADIFAVISVVITRKLDGITHEKVEGKFANEESVHKIDVDYKLRGWHLRSQAFSAKIVEAFSAKSLITN